MIDQARVLGVCEDLYQKYHRAEYLDPDPLQFVTAMPREHQESWGFLAAMVSLGRVGSIVQFLGKLYDVLGQDFVSSASRSKCNLAALKELTYRFYTGNDLLMLVEGLWGIVDTYGSLEGIRPLRIDTNREGQVPEPPHGNPLETIAALRSFILKSHPGISPHLLPDPGGNSAMKRYAMFLRWMVRSDSIDLGLWKTFSPKNLPMPVDTHILRHGQTLGFTKRKTADYTTAQEITAGFQKINPEDPTKYDFVLSRIGIHPVLKKINLSELLQ